jgi:hypothetical protein
MIKVPLSTVRHGNLVLMMVRQNRPAVLLRRFSTLSALSRMLTGHQD